MEWLRSLQKILGPWTGSLVLLFLRLFYGYHFAQHGVGKFMDLEKTASFFSELGIVLPMVTATAVALIETLGGIGLILGAFSPLTSLLLSIVMIGAYATAHTEGLLSFFSDPRLFVDQAPFFYLITSLLVFSFGAGKFSLDHFFWKNREN